MAKMAKDFIGHLKKLMQNSPNMINIYRNSMNAENMATQATLLSGQISQGS
jgi:hypothetical protein